MTRTLLLALGCLWLAACGARERSFSEIRRTSKPRLPAVSPLSAASSKVRWDSHSMPREVAANARVAVRVTFTNHGRRTWPVTRDGRFAVRLHHQWVPAGGVPSRRAGWRTNLPAPLDPGEQATVVIDVTAPGQPGEYQLVIELLQELVTWFEDYGADRLIIQVTVRRTGGSASGPDSSRAARSR